MLCKLNEFPETEQGRAIRVLWCFSRLSLTALFLAICFLSFVLVILPPLSSCSVLINVVASLPNSYRASWRIRSTRPDRSRPGSAWRNRQTRYRSRQCSSLRTDRTPIGRFRRNYDLTVDSLHQVACNIKHCDEFMNTSFI